MAIKIRHTYTTHVTIIFYADYGFTMRCDDCGQMDDIAKQVSETLVRHNFDYADICSAATGEVLMVIERT